ncbi:MAG: hypothetical protein K6G81_00525 [Lachnospiraceae bacterium]|nr:hypothetical protein [Lachnospiraceae bacterium]
MDKEDIAKRVKTLFKCRVALWVIAAAACIYWIVLSFWLYAKGVWEPHEYATYLRPRLYAALIISVVSLCVSFLLRRRSDEYKKQL